MKTILLVENDRRIAQNISRGLTDERLTRQQADSIFIKNNLLLLAERFRIDVGQAQILQASLRDNPTANLEISAFNNQTSRVLDTGRGGEKIISIQQLLYTAGKRNKRIALATEAAHLTELELLDLLRGLRFDLRSRFYAIYFQQQTLARYDRQNATIQTTVTAYERKYERNNVSLRELLRLKALLFQLSNDRTEIRFQLAEDQQSIRTLLPVIRPFAFLCAITLTGLLPACHPKPAPQEATAFILSDTMLSRIRIDTARTQPLRSELTLVGRIIADENRVIEVFPLVGGNVENVKVELGNYVQKGQTSRKWRVRCSSHWPGH